MKAAVKSFPAAKHGKRRMVDKLTQQAPKKKAPPMKTKRAMKAAMKKAKGPKPPKNVAYVPIEQRLNSKSKANARSQKWCISMTQLCNCLLYTSPSPRD